MCSNLTYWASSVDCTSCALSSCVLQDTKVLLWKNYPKNLFHTQIHLTKVFIWKDSTEMTSFQLQFLLLATTLTSGQMPNLKWSDWKEICGQGSFYLFSEDKKSWYILSTLISSNIQRSDAANNCELYGGYLAQVNFNQFEVYVCKRHRERG